MTGSAPNKTDGTTVRLHYKVIVRKFDGEYEPGKEPVSVQTFEFEEEASTDAGD